MNLAEISVPFVAHRLRRASTLYVDRAVMDEATALRLFAYAVPNELETAQDYLEDAATFHAERYGGSGIGHHGGAGRCGTSGAFQVKGIGRTPLVAAGSQETDFWHSHGNVTLVEALSELVWGEIFVQALPFGAVRVVAVIATGTDCWQQTICGARKKAPRALIVRAAAWRPAHFLRATWYQTPDEQEPDAARVRRAHAMLYADSSSGLLPGGEAAWFGAMAARWAHQIATSQIRRLLHGALHPSNVCLDGRWIDFGTATSLPTHANVKNPRSPLSFATLWEEQDWLSRVLHALMTHHARFAPNSTAFTRTPSHIDVQAQFSALHAHGLRMAVLRLLGLPADWISPHLGSRVASNLADALLKVVRSGNVRRREPRTDDLSRFGHARLGSVLALLALAESGALESGELDRRLAEHVPSEAERTALVESYRAHLLDATATAATHGASPLALQCVLRIGAWKASHPGDAFARARMRSEHEALSLRCADQQLDDEAATLVTAHVAERSILAATLYAPSQARYTRLFDTNGIAHYYDAIADRWLIADGPHRSLLADDPPCVSHLGDGALAMTGST